MQDGLEPEPMLRPGRGAKGRSSLVLLSMLTLLTLLFGVGCGREVGVGKPAPDFTATSVDGTTFTLSGYRGKVVLLNFWGIWCQPCRSEVPELAKLHDRLASKRFELIAIDVGDELAELEDFVAKQKLHFPVVMDSGQRGLYGIYTYPTNVVIDADGRIHSVSKGYSPGSVAQLEKTLGELLATIKP